jgi:hypothetical protein
MGMEGNRKAGIVSMASSSLDQESEASSTLTGSEKDLFGENNQENRPIANRQKLETASNNKYIQ